MEKRKRGRKKDKGKGFLDEEKSNDSGGKRIENEVV